MKAPKDVPGTKLCLKHGAGRSVAPILNSRTQGCTSETNQQPGEDKSNGWK